MYERCAALCKRLHKHPQCVATERAWSVVVHVIWNLKQKFYLSVYRVTIWPVICVTLLRFITPCLAP